MWPRTRFQFLCNSRIQVASRSTRGLLQNVNVSSGWLNVVDPGAEIHIREASVDHTWVVEKPSPHGSGYSLELFDGYGGDIVSILGARKDGTSQDVAWQGVLSALPDAA
ncbi:MAG: ChuX/HutX family heme-like substrate-binding protein [Acidobacteriota bacterium]